MTKERLQELRYRLKHCGNLDFEVAELLESIELLMDLAEQRQQHILELEKTCSELQEQVYKLDRNAHLGAGRE